MKNWFRSLSKAVRNILCLVPLAVGGGLVLIYALYEMLFILVIGIALIALSVFFLALNGKIIQEDKFKMSEEEEAEYQRKISENEQRGEADANLINDEDLDRAIEELQRLDDEKTSQYNRITDPSSKKEAAYELMYVNAKLRVAIKRKMKILKPNNQSANDSTYEIFADMVQEVRLPLYTKAVGVTFENYQEHIRESLNGDALLIKHNPSEQFPNSVDIINSRTNKSLGHVKSELADQLIDTFGQKFILSGEISEITGGTSDRPNLRCNIQILSISEESK